MSKVYSALDPWKNKIALRLLPLRCPSDTSFMRLMPANALGFLSSDAGDLAKRRDKRAQK